MGFDTSQQYANNLYWEAIRFYKIPEVDWVVPIMVVGEEILVEGTRDSGPLPHHARSGPGWGRNRPARLSCSDRPPSAGRNAGYQVPEPEDRSSEPSTGRCRSSTSFRFRFSGDSAVAGDSGSVADSAVGSETVEGGILVGGADTMAAAPEASATPPHRVVARRGSRTASSFRPPSRSPGTPREPRFPPGDTSGASGSGRGGAGTRVPWEWRKWSRNSNPGP